MLLRVGNVSDELLALLVVVLFLFLIAGISKGLHFLYHKYMVNHASVEQFQVFNGMDESE